MAQDPTTAGENPSDCEVMASIDGMDLVIAELCREEAWLSVPSAEAAVLEQWC